MSEPPWAPVNERVIAPNIWVLVAELGVELRVDTHDAALVRFRHVRRPGSAPPTEPPTA